MDWHRLGQWHRAKGDLVRAELSFGAAAAEVDIPAPPKLDPIKGVVLDFNQALDRRRKEES
ncbi:MAG: hypothetical protein ORO03_04680 [Alphaproteobacteria bacterium]|nr:hypothetical protein [Alphaproteobacteria bacterium]